ncbi:hypothetical protein ACOME3_000431 [Neoechinorhynchus agilis]
MARRSQRLLLNVNKSNATIDYTESLKLTKTPRRRANRLNAWGQGTFADLISMAIESSPEKRLKLKNIYEWFIDNYSYFRQRRDLENSKQWKNSIRHNLSLHSCFRKIKDGTGRDNSWWVINPNGTVYKGRYQRVSQLESKDEESFQEIPPKRRKEDEVESHHFEDCRFPDYYPNFNEYMGENYFQYHEVVRRESYEEDDQTQVFILTPWSNETEIVPISHVRFIEFDVPLSKPQAVSAEEYKALCEKALSKK